MTLRITHFERPLVLPDSAGRTHAILATGRLFSREPVEAAWLEEALDNYAAEDDLDRLADQRRLCVKRPIRLRADPLVEHPDVYELAMIDPSVPPQSEARNTWFCCHVLPMSSLDDPFLSVRGFFYESATVQVANALAVNEALATDLAVAFIGWAHRVLGADLYLTDLPVDLSEPKAPA